MTNTATNGHRTRLQQRAVTGLHEASHAVMSWMLGVPMTRVAMRDTADIRAGEAAGWVEGPDRPGQLSLTDAIAEIQVLLAGEGGARVAVVREPPDRALTAYGVEFVEPSLDDLLAIPSVGRDESPAHYGWLDGDGGQADLDIAEQMAADVTTTGLEAHALLRWLKVRTGAAVATPRFQSLVAALAPHLLADGELSGSAVERVLTVMSNQLDDEEPG